MNPPANCVFRGETLLGAQTMMDQKVMEVRWPPTPGWPGQITEWRAAALGCQALHAEIRTPQPDGSLKLVSETRAISLVLGNPDPHLFEDEPTYAEVKPSEAWRRTFEKVGWTWGPDAEQYAAQADNAYLVSVKMAGR